MRDRIKNRCYFLILLSVLAMATSCGHSQILEPIDEVDDSGAFGSDDTFEVMTWNLEHFAKNGDITVQYVSQILDSLDVDIIALQEIESVSKFNDLDDALEDWEGYLSSGAYYDINTAYLFRDYLQPDIYQILTSDYWALPRSPLVMEVEFGGKDFVIINNHFKALSGDENEERRREASEKLDQYIESYFSNDNVIVLGDLNDLLTDEGDDNVFSVFLDDSSHYLFADMAIAEGDAENFSYPGWPSHLDHILITNELFDEFENEGSDIQTLQVDEFFSNWHSYDENVSDHLPVAIKLEF